MLLHQARENKEEDALASSVQIGPPNRSDLANSCGTAQGRPPVKHKPYVKRLLAEAACLRPSLCLVRLSRNRIGCYDAQPAEGQPIIILLCVLGSCTLKVYTANAVFDMRLR